MTPPEEIAPAPSPAAEEPQRSPRAWIGRGVAWAAANRLKAALLAAGGAASILAVALATLWLSGPSVEASRAAMAMALERLDAGALRDAQDIARRLQEHGALPPEELGGPLFVLGAAAALEAEEILGRERRNVYRVGARYLEEARNRGFPEGRHLQGLILLGCCLFEAGEIPASRPVLREALEVADEPHQRRMLMQMLAAAYLADANPQYQDALAFNRLYLDEPHLPEDVLAEGLVERARILLGMGRIEECIETLDALPPRPANLADALVVRGEVLLREARSLREAAEEHPENLDQAAARYAEAIEVLRETQARDTLAQQATRKAMYLVGLCQMEMGERRAALEQFRRTSTRFPGTPEAFAAEFREGELLLDAGQQAEAVGAFRRVLETVERPEHYSNPWIALDELRRQMLVHFQRLLEGGNFGPCLELSRFFHPLFPRARALELSAETYARWGETLLAEADRLPPSAATEPRRQGREQLRRAGQVHGRLARLRIVTGAYTDDLWNAAECYMAGHDFRTAARMLDEYLRNVSHRRHPRALLYLGEAMLAMNRPQEALEALTQCIEFYPRDAAAFRARIVASRACREAGETERAAALLEENLTGDFLTPASLEWRNSLFERGELLFAEGEYEKAVERLSEAVARYPQAPQADLARYLVARAHLVRARQTRASLRDDLIERTRIVRLREMESRLEAALDGFRELRDALHQRREPHELDDLEAALLRNATFLVGNCLFELGDYEEAVKEYSITVNRYQNEPEVLEAYLQMSRAYHRLERPFEARGALEQAKVVLGRIRPDADFLATTNYDRRQWSELLDRLSLL